MTGSSLAAVKQYKKSFGEMVDSNLHGVVGPIVGVSGLLIGLAAQRKMNAVCLLAETYGHPMYLGIKGARELLRVLDKNLGLKLNLKKLEKEIKDIENEILKSSEVQDPSKSGTFVKGSMGHEMNYIG